MALDKKGNLVIIENKTDDSGKDVVWQALKYVSYCSSLKTSQIIAIYQDYLNAQTNNVGTEESAKERICEFFDISDIDEINLNEGPNQRMILVSAEFRKEVTSTILWLISKGIDAKCIQTTLHSIDERLFIDFAQIIPVKDAEDYVIGMSFKNSEERETKTVIHHREKLRLDFLEKDAQLFQREKFLVIPKYQPLKRPLAKCRFR